MITQIQIAEAVGPDAWDWAFKQGMVSDKDTVETLIRAWYDAGADEKTAEIVGGLIMSIAGAYLDDYTHGQQETA